MQRLSELTERFEVHALCPPCERMEALPLAELLTRFGPEATLTDIRPRLRCRCCGVCSGELRVIYVGEKRKAARFLYGHR